MLNCCGLSKKIAIFAVEFVDYVYYTLKIIEQE